MKKLLTLGIVLGIFVVGMSVAQAADSVVISEFSANNGTDWVELRNLTGEEIDLTDWELFDDSSSMKVLGGTLSAGGYVSFDVSTRLNMDGDIIRLSTSSSTDDVIDSVPYGDASEALIVAPAAGEFAFRDSSGAWHVVTFNTKGSANVEIMIGSDFYPTIQAAIDSDIGEVINVGAGTYIGNVTIDRGVTLMGTLDGSGNPTATIEGQVTIASDDVTIDGLGVTNPSGSTGILSSSRSGLVIKNSTITGVGTLIPSGSAQGIYLLGGSSGFSTVLIENNKINNIGHEGLVAGGGSSAKGIFIGDSTGNGLVENVTINGNILHAIASARGAYGVLVNYGSHSTATGTTNGLTITNNIVGKTEGQLSGLWTHAVGLEGPTVSTVVSGNTFSGLVAGGVDKSAVFFEKNPFGGEVEVSLNKFSSSDFIGVGIHPNDLPEGANGLDYVVNALNNWWGHKMGPTHPSNEEGLGALVSDNVNFAPWYAGPTITRNGGELVNVWTNQAAYVELGATATGWGIGDVDTDGSVDSSTPGTYTVTYTVADEFNNEVSTSRTVIVRSPSSGGGGGGGGSSAVSSASPVAQAVAAAQATPVVGEVLGAFTPAERAAQIAVVRTQLVSLISQLIGLLEAQLAAAITAQGN